MKKILFLAFAAMMPFAAATGYEYDITNDSVDVTRTAKSS